jgi:hypothetical protein
VLQWSEQSGRKVHMKKKGGMISSPLYLYGRGPFIDCLSVPKLWVGYFTTRVKLHGQWGPRLETLIHCCWIRIPDCSSWLSCADVAGARDGSWSCLRFTLLYLDAKPSYVGADVDDLVCCLHRPTDCG